MATTTQITTQLSGTTDDWTESWRAIIALENLLQCFICDRVMTEPHTLGGCDHHFCRECISTVLSGGSSCCPICQVPVWNRDLQTNRQMDNLIKMVTHLKQLLGHPSQTPSSSENNEQSSPKKLHQDNTILNSTKENVLVSTTKSLQEVVFKKPRPLRRIPKSKHSTGIQVKINSQPTMSHEHKEADALKPTTANSSLRHNTCTPQDTISSPTSVCASVPENIDPRQSLMAKNDHTVPDGGNSQRPGKILRPSSKLPCSPLMTRTRSFAKQTKPNQVLTKNSGPVRKIVRQSKLVEYDVKCSAHEVANGLKSHQGLDDEGAALRPETSHLSQATVPSTRKMKRNIRGETPLHIAAIKGDVDEVTSLLQLGADPNARDNAGWTPLHEACNHGHPGVVAVLLASNALVNSLGFDNDTPLHDAVSNGHTEVARLLLNNGASLKIRNGSGLLARDLATTESMRALLDQYPHQDQTTTSTTNKALSAELYRKEIVIMCTGLKSYQKKAVDDFARENGARIVASFTPQVTHVVTSCNRGRCCSRTLKFLCGVAAGKWIVSMQWVTDSLAASCVLGEEQYEVTGVVIGGSCLTTNAPHRARLNVSSELTSGLFEGCNFFLAGSFQPPQASRQDLGQLISLAGGTLLTTRPDHTTNVPASTYIVLDQDSQEYRRLRSGDYNSIRFVQPSWILDCLSCFEVMT